MFPGFDDLNEESSVESIAGYIQRKMIKDWVKICKVVGKRKGNGTRHKKLE